MAAGASTAERGAVRRQGPPGPPLLRRLGPRRLRLALALAVAAVLLAAGGAWVLYGSSWLRVERVAVSGTDVLTPDQVRDAARVPVGSPLVSIDTDAIRSRLERALPRVDEVDVSRSWPHGVVLKVTERVPVLLIRHGAGYTEVDDEGVRFATVPQPPEGAPLLELALSNSGSTAASLRRFGEDRLVREAVRAAGSLPSAVLKSTKTVKVRSYDDISLDLADGRTVSWGSSEKGAAKSRALSALMKAQPDARHFDVSVPTAPASAGS
ncbi:FtsQ-type POTRA domain-containing protein [Streptomyces roseirectus]|uniref:Cell division protein FtsQ n=1 Tax=Streptomyces roseirectus TaxID=2768066 RepID=A0A7H0IKA2_9ACTN|nr:FtsQ-type POTRA domain-containing protein [Streptomyces roseirectus]QNP73218.1 FtsQ-type POTRA domain-containing protein [Streptomyces roseirectus]